MLKLLFNLKRYFLKLFAYWNVSKPNSTTNSSTKLKNTAKTSISFTKSIKQRNPSQKRDQSSWSKQYNQKLEVKARKHEYYQANKQKFNELRRQRRQLAKESANENKK